MLLVPMGTRRRLTTCAGVRFRELHILEQGTQSWRPRIRVGAETTQDIRHITIPSEFRIPSVWAQGSIFLKAP